MGGHGHGAEPYKVPSASSFKVEAPEQLEYQKALGRLGLSDPWIRNEAWRYLPGQGTHASRARALFTRGFLPGLIAATITATCEIYLSKSHEHGHEEEH